MLCYPIYMHTNNKRLPEKVTTYNSINSLGAEGMYICPQLLPATTEGIYIPTMKFINKEICLRYSSVFPLPSTKNNSSKFQKFYGKNMPSGSCAVFCKAHYNNIRLCVRSKCKQTGASATTMALKEIYTVNDVICKNWG